MSDQADTTFSASHAAGSPAPASGRVLHEHTTRGWQVLGSVLICGALAALGFYLRTVGHAEDFATVASIALLFTISFWAHKRPDRVVERFGPFGKIADATRESLDDIRAWIYDRPLRVGFVIAVGYGVFVVLLKSLMLVLIDALYSWELAVVAGALLGAAVAAPELFRGAAHKLAGSASKARPVAGSHPGDDRV